MSRNPPPQSPYYTNYTNNPVSPKNPGDRLPDVPESPSTANGEPATASSGTPAPAKEQRLIVVSNRLPVTISKDKNGEYHFSMSSGGLVSALSGTKKKMSFTWIGWPGKHIPEADREHVNKRLLDEYSCYPVYLSDELADRHYNGFSNSILWPLFHYHPGEMNFSADNWLAYREANMQFADVVASMCSAGDMVWVQDYHLMLLPMLLRTVIGGESSQGDMVRRELGRVKQGMDEKLLTGALGVNTGHAAAAADDHRDEGVEMLEDVGEDEPLQIETKSTVGKMRRPGMQRGLSSFQQQELKAKEKGKEGIRIGFFLHTPFPSSEIYRILPVRREILLGVLQCDLIGFHTYDYARHFLSSCTRILGLETEPNGIDFEGRFAQVGTFPIGIDPYAFVEAVKKPHVEQRTRSLEAKFDGKKVIIGVDRLDYIKGIPQKLQSFEIFLSQHPSWVEKCVLVQLAIPSRQDVEEYQNLRACVNELVGKINGRFGTVDHTPIHYLHRSVPFEELCSMYAMSDACLITSTRDGMNLVAYEYISSQSERHGSLILSEFAGAAQSLAGSLIINPWDCQQTANAIHQSLLLSKEQRSSNWDKLWNYVSRYTAEAWGTSFVNELTNLSGHRPSGPAIPGRKKSGSLSRASSKASMARRSSHGHGLNQSRDARDVMT